MEQQNERLKTDTIGIEHARAQQNRFDGYLQVCRSMQHASGALRHDKPSLSCHVGELELTDPILT